MRIPPPWTDNSSPRQMHWSCGHPHPNGSVLKKAYKVVSPARLYLFNHQPVSDTISIVKKSIQTALDSCEGWLSTTALAAASAQTDTLIHTLLEFFTANGQLTILTREADRVQLARGGTSANKENIAQIGTQLKYLQGETEAYRRFYATAKPDTLLGPDDN